MEPLKSLTCVYYLGMACGLWKKDEIIEWCDKAIETLDNPPIVLLDVSMMSKSKIDDIKRKLFEFCKIEDEEHFSKIVLSIIFEKLKNEQLSIERAIRVTTRLLVETGLSCDNEYYYLYSLDDSYDLAMNGVHYQLTEVERDFIIELGAYKEYIFEFKEMYYRVLKQEWVK